MSLEIAAEIARINAEHKPGACPFTPGTANAAYWHFQRLNAEGAARGAREVAWAGYRAAYKREHKRDVGPLPSNIVGEAI